MGRRDGCRHHLSDLAMRSSAANAGIVRSRTLAPSFNFQQFSTRPRARASERSPVLGIRRAGRKAPAVIP